MQAFRLSASTPANRLPRSSERSPTSVPTSSSPARPWAQSSQTVGYKHPVCVIQAQGHVGLEARCAGVKAKVPGTEILYVNGADMTSVESTATAKLQASKDADVIIGLGAPITLTLLKSVATAGSSAKVASFDLNKELAQKVSDGSVLFTVDQQPWLQGYGAVDALWQNKRGGFKHRRRPVGPDRPGHH